MLKDKVSKGGPLILWAGYLAWDLGMRETAPKTWRFELWIVLKLERNGNATVVFVDSTDFVEVVEVSFGLTQVCSSWSTFLAQMLPWSVSHVCVVKFEVPSGFCQSHSKLNYNLLVSKRLGSCAAPNWICHTFSVAELPSYQIMSIKHVSWSVHGPVECKYHNIGQMSCYSRLELISWFVMRIFDDISGLVCSDKSCPFYHVFIINYSICVYVFILDVMCT